MGTLSDNYTENVRLFDEALGVGRSVDMVSRDYVIGGRRARIWVVDGYGLDETLALWPLQMDFSNLPLLDKGALTHKIMRSAFQ